jgi:hypothetical protein
MCEFCAGYPMMSSWSPSRSHRGPPETLRELSVGKRYLLKYSSIFGHFPCAPVHTSRTHLPLKAVCLVLSNAISSTVKSDVGDAQYNMTSITTKLNPRISLGLWPCDSDIEPSFCVSEKVRNAMMTKVGNRRSDWTRSRESQSPSQSQSLLRTRLLISFERNVASSCRARAVVSSSTAERSR